MTPNKRETQPNVLVELTTKTGTDRERSVLEDPFQSCLPWPRRRSGSGRDDLWRGILGVGRGRGNGGRDRVEESSGQGGGGRGWKEGRTGREEEGSRNVRGKGVILILIYVY